MGMDPIIQSYHQENHSSDLFLKVSPPVVYGILRIREGSLSSTNRVHFRKLTQIQYFGYNSNSRIVYT
jgi:hypothetical protein